MRGIFVLAAGLLLASCHREEQPQAPTPAESERLDEAEEMLNELANEGGAAASAPRPEG